MTQPQNERRRKLEAVLAADPDNAFARYGLAMECSRAGDHEAAVEHFRRLLEAHPDYVAGYFQYGQFLTGLARVEEAKKILALGIEVARRAGNEHARAEMEAALSQLI